MASKSVSRHQNRMQREPQRLAFGFYERWGVHWLFQWLSVSQLGIGNLLVVLCRRNVAKSLSVPIHPSPPYFYIQQPLKHV